MASEDVISDGLWEDLENISLPSLPFQLQFPDSETPLQCEDEADLLPSLHLDPDPDLDLGLDIAAMAASVTADSVLEDHVSRLEVSDQLSRLHVMVCGFCHRVFHHTDQFISHTHFCSPAPRPPARPAHLYSDMTAEAVAGLLWTGTTLRTVKEQMIRDSDADDDTLSRAITRKWYGLSDNLRRSWIRAAEVLIQISNVRKHLELPSPCSTMKKSTKGPLNKSTSLIHNSETEVGSKNTKNQNNYHCHRDTKGRWTSKEEVPKSDQQFKCDICKFTAATDWKLKRHEMTRKHLELCQINSQQEYDLAAENIEINLVDDEIEEFGVLEFVNEKEFLHASPCDIIMEDTH